MHLTHTTAAALAAAALLAPTASARLPVEEQSATPVYRAAPDPDRHEPRPVATQMTRIEPRVTAPTATETTTADDGFDWGSAAIGAGAAGAVLLLTAAGASAAGHRRHGVA